MSAKTALVVDDSKSARFALRRFLENHQFKVETAESAEEAYTMLRAHRPEVIFLDHVMPGTDGFTALKHIKNDPATGSIPVVICSSNEGPQFNEDARTQGAAHVLQKPPSPERLSAILSSLQKFSAELREPDPDLKFADTGKFTPDGQVVPAAAMPPPAPSKVSNIREPEVAIEQAVMKALRGAIQTRVEAAAPPAPVAPAAPVAAAAPAVADAHAAGALREQMEARLKKITQELFVQMAELKGSLAHLEAQVEAGAKDKDAAAAIAPLQQKLASLEQNVQQQFADLRKQLEAGLAAQAERISQVTHAARQAAAQEAHAVAERTVMSAASRISDQLSESILKAINAR
ncbi:MAG TPA: response regulator [Nevskiaceae bacterium]|nr:response regulator [Nevskiaceae bacterium]